MKTLIAYGTKHGCTEKCAKELSEKLNGSVELVNLKTNKNVDLSAYDIIIIGGSIYMGNIQKEVREFCSKELEALKNKKLGLFICCMAEEETALQQIDKALPKDLIDHALTKDYFGGEFIFKKMGFMERIIVKKVSKVEMDKSNILFDRIDKFASVINNV